MATLENIKAQIARLTKQAHAMEGRAVQKVLALMNKLGVTVDDLPKGRGRNSKAVSKGRQTTGTPKYRDPATGKTWTGHGRAPEWIKNAQNRDDFLVGNGKSDGAGVSSSPAKPTKKARKALGTKSAKRSTGTAVNSGRGRKLAKSTAARVSS